MSCLLNMPEDMQNLLLSVGHAVAQLVEALRYKPEGRWFDSRFFIDIILSVALWPWGQLGLSQKWVPGIFPGG
jgi:hypothetical protein